MPSDIWAVRKGPTGPELPTVALGDVPGASGAEFSAHPYLLNPYLVATDFLGLSPCRRDTWFFWEKREPDPQSLHLNFAFGFVPKPRSAFVLSVSDCWIFVFNMFFVLCIRLSLSLNLVQWGSHDGCDRERAHGARTELAESKPGETMCVPAAVRTGWPSASAHACMYVCMRPNVCVCMCVCVRQRACAPMAPRTGARGQKAGREQGCDLPRAAWSQAWAGQPAPALSKLLCRAEGGAW